MNNEALKTMTSMPETDEVCCCTGNKKAEVQNEVNTVQASCCCGRTRIRSEEEYIKLRNRLNRIEGQVRGLKGMLDSNAYCTDILVQVTAVNAALNAFSRELLDQHIRTCVIDDIRAGKEETVDDLLRTLQKMMK